MNMWSEKVDKVDSEKRESFEKLRQIRDMAV